MTGEASGPVRVDAVSFVRAESDTYFDSLLATAGGLGRWHHIREPAPVDRQLVVRMNRDTLYSSVVIDVSAGADLTMPETGGRYQTAMVVDQDHYITTVYDRPGIHRLAAEESGTGWVAIAVRTLVDPADPADLAAVAALQDRLAVTARSAKPFSHPAWDPDSLAATRKPLLELARGLTSMKGAFGSRQQTDPVAHLLGTAAGWGGLPQDQALYLGVEPGLPAGHYSLTVGIDNAVLIRVTFDALVLPVPQTNARHRLAVKLSTILARKTTAGWSEMLSGLASLFPRVVPGSRAAPRGRAPGYRTYRPAHTSDSGPRRLSALRSRSR